MTPLSLITQVRPLASTPTVTRSPRSGSTSWDRASAAEDHKHAPCAQASFRNTGAAELLGFPSVEDDVVRTVLSEQSRQMKAVLPDATIFLTGSASVSGLSAVDVDLVALVADVPIASHALGTIYAPLYREHWSDEWAAFRVDGSPQVDIVLTKRGTKWDKHHRLSWDLLRRDERLLAEYAALKAEPEDYEARKAIFFERVVRLLPPDS